jgi:hypothetical protein
MQRMLFATAAAIVVAASVHSSPTFAASDAGATAPRAVEQRVAAAPSQAAHYQWQYHYAGSHSRFEGHWVLVR